MKKFVNLTIEDRYADKVLLMKGYLNYFTSLALEKLLESLTEEDVVSMVRELEKSKQDRMGLLRTLLSEKVKIGQEKEKPAEEKTDSPQKTRKKFEGLL